MAMEKKTSNLGLFSGLPPVGSDKEVMAQWLSGPRVLEPNPVDKLFRRRKATKAEKPSENSPKD